MVYGRRRVGKTRLIKEYIADKLPLEYSDDAWNLLIDHATIDSDGMITICFVDHLWPWS